MLRLILCSVGLCLLSLIAPTAASAQFNADSYYRLIPRHSGQCLDIPGRNYDNTIQLQQYTCNSVAQDNQLWTLVPAGFASAYRIVSGANAKCLDVRNASLANGAAIQQYDCNLASPFSPTEPVQPNQLFYIAPSLTSGYYWIYSRQSALAGTPKCLDITALSTAPGALVQQWDCSLAVAQSNQEWAVQAFTPRVHTTHIGTYGYYFDVGKAQMNPVRDHINYSQVGPGSVDSDLPSYAQAGIYGQLAMFTDLQDDPIYVNHALFRLKWTRNGELNPDHTVVGPGPCPGSPDDIYSRCPNESGLRLDWLTVWNTNLKPKILANISNIKMFYFDEPYVTFESRLFSEQQTREIMNLVTHQIHVDFPGIPIVIVNPSEHLARDIPPDVSWVGVYCYGWSSGVPVCPDQAGTWRPYADIVALMKSAHFGKTPIVIANADVPPPHPDPAHCDPACLAAWRASFSPTFAAAADYFLNVALRDPNVEAMFIWSYFTSGSPTTLPDVKAKYRFLGRALGFGCTEGLSCPAPW